jgi:biopolymer transport protein ExbD
MVRFFCGMLIAAAVCACSSEENKDPGLLDRAAEAVARDQRAAAEERRALELQRQRLAKLQAEIEAEKRSGLHVDLPSGAAQDIDVTHASIVIVLPANGNPTISGRAMSDQDLDNVFRAAVARDKTTQVVIQADRNASHGRVVSIMEKAKAAGLTHLAIGTLPP